MSSLWCEFNGHATPIISVYHREDGGDPQPHPGWGRVAVQIEADPGHDDNEAAGDVHLDDVVTHRPDITPQYISYLCLNAR